MILNGARQVGKTWALKEFGKQEFTKTHYINFEKQDNFKTIFEKDLDPKRIYSEIEMALGIRFFTK